MWPAALTVAALLALVLGFALVGFACLGLAFAAKVYALVLLVPAALYVAARWGWRRVAWCLGAFVLAAAVLVVPFLAASADGVWSSIRSQVERGLHVESLGASVLLVADRLWVYDATVGSGSTEAKSARRGRPGCRRARGRELRARRCGGRGGLARLRAPPGRPARLAVSFAAGVAAVLAFGKVLSPQYAEWLLFLVPLAAGAPGVAAAALAGAAFLLARLWFHHYDRLFDVEERRLAGAPAQRRAGRLLRRAAVRAPAPG